MWINGKELGGQGRCQWNSTTQASTERDETVWDGTKQDWKEQKETGGGDNNMKQYGKERDTTGLDGTEKDGSGRDRTGRDDICDGEESRRRTKQK